MEEKMITLAIHTNEKAKILKNTLESRGILVVLEKMEDHTTHSIVGIAVRVKESDLSRALSIIEENRLFNYSDKETYKIDDGRKRILVAVDFSHYSLHACKTAFHIAKTINAKVKILHVMYNIQYPSSLPLADMMRKEGDVTLLDRVRKQMLDLCYEIDQKITEGEFPSINYSYSIREGIVEEEIENFIEEYKPVLLVLGTKGKDNNENGVLGNVTADIIEITNVPVLAVPANAPFESLSRNIHVAYLTNLQKRDVLSFETLVSFLKPYGDIRITLVHLNVSDRKGESYTEEELARMQEYFNAQYPEVNVSYKLIDAVDMVKAVNDFITEENVNAVALNTRRRNLLGRIFAPSMTRKILEEPRVSILVLRG